MGERIVSPRVRLLPGVPPEPAGSDSPVSGEEEALAQMAVLSGVGLSNAGISLFLRGLSNSQYSSLINQGVS